MIFYGRHAHAFLDVSRSRAPVKTHAMQRGICADVGHIQNVLSAKVLPDRPGQRRGSISSANDAGSGTPRPARPEDDLSNAPSSIQGIDLQQADSSRNLIRAGDVTNGISYDLKRMRGPPMSRTVSGPRPALLVRRATRTHHFRIATIAA